MPPATRPRTSRYALFWRLALALLLIAAILLTVGLGHAPRWLGLAYLGIGALSAFAYWSDKQAAISGAWRITELRLHGLDLVGGIVGGLMAQIAWRHKTAKPDFGLVSGSIACLHIIAMTALLFGVFDLAP